VPVAVGGLVFFALVLLLAWGSRGRSRIADSAPAYIFSLSTLALAVVLYLAYASFFVLKEVCPLCVATYVAVAGVFIISGGASSVPLSSLPKRVVRDLGALVATPVALVIALLFVAGAASAVAFFPSPQERPAVKMEPLAQDQRTELERWWDLQPKIEMPYSNDGAKVLLVKFNDYQCPPCRATYFAYEPVIEKYKDRPKDFRYELKHYPLDPSCNGSVASLVHPAACDAAAAAVMAVPKGTFDKLTDWFFMHQDQLSPATVRTAAREVGGITDFDAEYPRAIQEVKTEAATGAALGVNSTPTFFLNGRKVGGLPPAAMDALIELEIKRAGGQ
jgi:protein-disulfide isomerase